MENMEESLWECLMEMGSKYPNLNIKRRSSRWTGLFRIIGESGKIKNLGVENALVRSSNDQGTGIIAGAVLGEIENSYVKNSRISRL